MWPVIIQRVPAYVPGPCFYPIPTLSNLFSEKNKLNDALWYNFKICLKTWEQLENAWITELKWRNSEYLDNIELHKNIYPLKGTIITVWLHLWLQKAQMLRKTLW